MSDDPIVSGLDVEFGSPEFGPSGFDINLDMSMTPLPSTATIGLSKQSYCHHQHQQQQSTYNDKINTTNLNDGTNSVSSLRKEIPSATVASTSSGQPGTGTSAATTDNKQAGTALATSGSGLTNMPLGLPYHAAGAVAGIQQRPVYSLVDMQYTYQHLAVGGYYEIGYQSPTKLGGGLDGTLASLAYATGTDANFSRNENNFPGPTSLSQVNYK